MKKSKLKFAIFAVIILIAVVAVAIISSGQDDRQPEETGVPTETTLPGLPGEIIRDPDETLPMEMPMIEHPFTTIDVANNVTITKVDPKPDDVVGTPVTQTDPEYLHMDGGDQYLPSEGKIFRNDKTLAIDLFDEYTGESFTVQFGYITGECNRWLYLNPIFTSDDGETDVSDKYAYHFNLSDSSGNIITIAPDYGEPTEMLKHCDNFVFERTLDQLTPATYYGPTYPGTVWFAQTPVGKTAWIDVLVYQYAGDLLATLRLTIARDADGSYSFVNLENKNLLQTYDQENSPLPISELQYIYAIACGDVNNEEKTNLFRYEYLDTPIERFIIEYRDIHDGLYFPYFVPEGTTQAAWSDDFMYNPVIAVSCRQHVTADCITLYYSVVKPHTKTEHGTYDYIGRDFMYYFSSTAMANQGYPGINPTD